MRSIEELDLALLVGAAVLLVAIAAARLASRTGLPSLLLFLGLGLLLGNAVPGLGFDDPALARVLGYAALVLILAEGGLTTSWAAVRPAAPVAASLATVGVAVSVLVTAALTYAVLDVDWRYALLLAAVVASTDAAAVFSLLRNLPLPRRLAGMLEAESGFNDAPVVILVVALSTDIDQPLSPMGLIALVAAELAGGAAVGLAVGRGGAAIVRRFALPASGLYPISVLSLAVGAYGLAAVLHASGFLAVYVAALVLGNARLPHGPATRSFVEGLAWLAQIGLFVMLGLLVNPAQLGAALLPAVVVGLVLLLLARPLSVLLACAPFRVPWREQAFLSWAGLRGAVPIVLATVPLVTRFPESERLFDIVFVLVVVFTLVQAPALPAVARALGLTDTSEARDLDVESLPLEALGADMLQFRVPADSGLHGVEIFELRLPREAAITLVVRDGKAFVPEPTTHLRRGDELLLVTTAAVRELTERRLRAVSRQGRLAGWFGEDGRDESEPASSGLRWRPRLRRPQ